jgi:hypothetical protein
MNEREWLEAMLEACESEARGMTGSAAYFIRMRHGGDQLMMVRKVREHFLGNPMERMADDGDSST